MDSLAAILRHRICRMHIILVGTIADCMSSFNLRQMVVIIYRRGLVSPKCKGNCSSSTPITGTVNTCVLPHGITNTLGEKEAHQRVLISSVGDERCEERFQNVSTPKRLSVARYTNWHLTYAGNIALTMNDV
jgi:hypothetical protein